MNGAGTFYLTIDEPSPTGVGACGGALPLAVYGVALAFDFAGQIAGATPPATVQIN